MYRGTCGEQEGMFVRREASEFFPRMPWCKGFGKIFYHLYLSAHHAADMGPLAMFFRCRALKEALFFFILSLSPGFGLPAVSAPCCPKRIVFTLDPIFTTTMCDFVGWWGVSLGRLYAVTPARARRGSGDFRGISITVFFMFGES